MEVLLRRYGRLPVVDVSLPDRPKCEPHVVMEARCQGPHTNEHVANACDADVLAMAVGNEESIMAVVPKWPGLYAGRLRE